MLIQKIKKKLQEKENLFDLCFETCLRHSIFMLKYTRQKYSYEAEKDWSFLKSSPFVIKIW